MISIFFYLEISYEIESFNVLKVSVKSENYIK